MCARTTMIGPFTVATSVRGFGYRNDRPIQFSPRYNIAPTQELLAVAANRVTPPTLTTFRWGLVPAGASNPKIGARLINARAETVAVKPAFRMAMRRRRCLILVDGFFEWQTIEGRAKQPWYIRMKDAQAFALAGLWERWTDARTGDHLTTCTIITTRPNALMAPIHDRMPVILDPADYARWIDPMITEPNAVEDMLRPWAADSLDAYPVSTFVNSPKHEGPECVEAAPR